VKSLQEKTGGVLDIGSATRLIDDELRAIEAGLRNPATQALSFRWNQPQPSRRQLVQNFSVLAKRRFQLVLIKPSHYDDDGYVIRWWRAMTPSNSLAAVYGISADCAERRVLGPDIDIEIEAIDETNTRIDIPALRSRFRDHDNFGCVALVGVQSNQYPRALDIARPFREAGIAVIIGGFHVSGCLAMLDGHAVDLDACRDMGVTIFAGETEGRLGSLLADVAAGRLAPLYNYMKDLPAMEGAPPPFLPKRYIERTLGSSASFDAGRGCPYQCSFCTIINVQGRKSRHRSADDIERLVRLNWAQGIRKFFITDDNFARNKDWESILDRLIELREKHGIPLGLMIQVDTLCHKIPNFTEKAKRAGVNKVFIGLENINPANLAKAKKRQNKITEYRKMLLAWKKQGILTIAGYILGFPEDTPETIKRDIAIIKEELPIDLLEFFCLTPLPGSEDHQTLWKNGIPMDEDLNRYDVEHVCTAHPKMTRQEWQDIYHQAWLLYYTPEHMKTLLRRAAATGVPVANLAKYLLTFSTTDRLEKVHPLQGGILRLKHPSERRPGLPRENPWLFWLRFCRKSFVNHAILAGAMLRMLIWQTAIAYSPGARNYADQALTPVSDDEDETLDLLTKTTGARAAVAHIKKVAEVTGARVA
jgi:Radical SAM superfamily